MSSITYLHHLPLLDESIFHCSGETHANPKWSQGKETPRVTQSEGAISDRKVGSRRNSRTLGNKTVRGQVSIYNDIQYAFNKMEQLKESQ